MCRSKWCACCSNAVTFGYHNSILLLKSLLLAGLVFSVHRVIECMLMRFLSSYDIVVFTWNLTLITEFWMYKSFQRLRLFSCFSCTFHLLRVSIVIDIKCNPCWFKIYFVLYELNNLLKFCDICLHVYKFKNNCAANVMNLRRLYKQCTCMSIMKLAAIGTI